MQTFSRLTLIYIVLTLIVSCISAQTPNKEARTLFPIYQNDKCGYINNQGKVVIRPQFVVCQDFSEGLAQVYMGSRENLKQGFINPTGQYVVEPKYFTAMPFSEGLARVCEGDSDSSGITMRGCGFIDTTGKVVIALRFREAYGFSDGLAKVDIRNRGEYCDYVDRTGRLVLSYDWVSAQNGISVGGFCQSFKDGLAPIHINDKWGYIDKKGNIAIEPQYEMAFQFEEGVAAVRKDGKAGFINRTGNIVIPLRFGAALPFSEGLAFAVPLNGNKWGFIDKSGKFVVDPKYGGTQSFSEDLVAISTKQGYGYIDRTGKVVITPKFSGAMPFKGGLAEVEVGGNGTFRRGNMKGYINKKGVFVWKPSK